MPPRKTSRRDAKLLRDIARTAIGPVIHKWLLALDQYVAYFDDSDTAFLYCARAGVRIRRLFELYRSGRGAPLDDRHGMLWSSRVGLCKALYARDPERASELIAAEYHHHPLRDAVAGLLRNAPDRLAALDLETADLAAHGHQFPGWILSEFPAAKALRAYFAESGTAFDVMLAETIRGAGRVVLIDSGWQGSGQALLGRAFPELDVHGLYLGRILTGRHDPTVADRVIGLLFEADRYDPDRPETAVVFHRHLFEALLEPDGPSIEEVPGGPCDAAARAQIGVNATETPSRTADALFVEVERYIGARAGATPERIEADARRAMPALARLLVHPTREEALALAGKDRSADFGKTAIVPVLVTDPADPGDPSDHADARIARSLWTQGQIALEHTGRMRHDLQRKASGLTDDAAYFDPAGHRPVRPALIAADATRVSIVTRTKNRPLLLRRAAESVAAQSHPAIEWIVVNDGGDEEAVEGVLRTCAVDRRAIRLVSHADSVGMEAASNAGIAEATGAYLLIHDDDDTLRPAFLERTVGFLESPAGRRYGGVVTGTEYVSEEISGDRVIEHESVPYMDWVENVQLAELLAQNLFAPIAFLYRRSVYEQIGGYNPVLPVLGDWYFNLEFALISDIAVLPETLARYHHRDRGDSSRLGLYANSVIGGHSKHLEFAAVMRNMFMRRHGRTDPVAAAAIGAYFASDMRTRLDRIEARLIGESPRNAPAPGHDGPMIEEVDRLWALTGLMGRAASQGAAGAPVARALADRAGAPLPEIRAILRDARIALPAHPSFDEPAYLAQYPDVAAAVSRGQFGSGHEHFLLYGQDEGRARPTR